MDPRSFHTFLSETKQKFGNLGVVSNSSKDLLKDNLSSIH